MDTPCTGYRRIIRRKEFRFGLVVLPFALVDGFAIWALVKWSEKRSHLK
jgi:hypothetical protein